MVPLRDSRDVDACGDPGRLHGLRNVATAYADDRRHLCATHWFYLSPSLGIAIGDGASDVDADALCCGLGPCRGRDVGDDASPCRFSPADFRALAPPQGISRNPPASF